MLRFRPELFFIGLGDRFTLQPASPLAASIPNYNRVLRRRSKSRQIARGKAKARALLKEPQRFSYTIRRISASECPRFTHRQDHNRTAVGFGWSPISGTIHHEPLGAVHLDHVDGALGVHLLVG